MGIWTSVSTPRDRSISPTPITPRARSIDRSRPLSCSPCTPSPFWDAGGDDPPAGLSGGYRCALDIAQPRLGIVEGARCVSRRRIYNPGSVLWFYVLIEAMLLLLIVIFERSGSTFSLSPPSLTTVFRMANLGVPLDSDRQYFRAVYYIARGCHKHCVGFSAFWLGMDYGIGPPRHTDILEAAGHLGTTGKSMGVNFEGDGHGYIAVFVSGWPLSSSALGQPCVFTRLIRYPVSPRCLTAQRPGVFDGPSTTMGQGTGSDVE